VFDLDGTIRLTERLVPGAQAAVNGLRQRGSRIVFLTNNSDGTREMFADELTQMGIATAPDEVVCTSFVMARYLRAQLPGCRCYVIGPDPLREELSRAGLLLRDRPGDIDYVVLGIDRDFTYRKQQTAFEAIRSGARFVATNPDRYSPSARGDLADIGALIAAIETATEHPLDEMIGKPNPIILETALEVMGLSRDDCLIVGDQLHTDVLAGQRAGMKTALLLRDPRVLAQLDEWPTPPNYGLDSLLDLVIQE
jgi:HAD superfamily hydrolase (TIGR01450 family)